MRTSTLVLCALLLSAGALHAEEAVDPAACERLAASLVLPNTTVTLVEPVPAGQFVPPGGEGAVPAQAFADLPAFCRVALTMKPTSDSDIRAEVWLPLSEWNGKFQQVGNGAWGGSIQYRALADGLRRGYAAASTDTGHRGTDASFAVGHPEKLIDFGYRSVHETAVKSKATIAALYGTPPELSYFTGCSGGGRQAFMEAQRYPEDFDGIIAGAPGYDRTNQFFQLVMMAQATLSDPTSTIPASKYPVIHQAALDACDAGDGAIDGIIGDPMRCEFDPEVLLCSGAEGPDCLTRAQVDAARKIYAPVVDPNTGEAFFPGLEPGSELRWGVTSGGPRPLAVADDLFKYVVFQDPDWDFRTLDPAKHLELARRIDNGILSASSVEIQPFIDRGGKLLIYHGWGDQNISPRSSVNYYHGLVDRLGQDQVDEAVRLYMVPAMGHCGGGEGPNVFDMLTVLEQWREDGKAPAEVLASQLASDGTVIRTRPLCPYPQVAYYSGSGSLDDAENFVCRTPGTPSN